MNHVGFMATLNPMWFRAGTLGFEPRTEILEIPMIAISPRPRILLVPVPSFVSFGSFFRKTFRMSFFELFNILFNNVLQIPPEKIANHRNIPHRISQIFPDSFSLVVTVRKRLFNATGHVSGFSGDSQSPGEYFLFFDFKFFCRLFAKFLIFLRIHIIFSSLYVSCVFYTIYRIFSILTSSHRFLFCLLICEKNNLFSYIPDTEVL